MRQSLKAYPHALEEAAEIDGAGTLQILIKIMLPGAMPVMATSLMFTFVWKWTDPTYTELFLPNKEYLWVKMGSIGSVLQILPSVIRNERYTDHLQDLFDILLILSYLNPQKDKADFLSLRKPALSTVWREEVTSSFFYKRIPYNVNQIKPIFMHGNIV